MFSVINWPCTAGDYNELPDVIDADATLKPLEAELEELIRRGSEACLATPFEHGSLGGFLLHKHRALDEGYSMVERHGQCQNPQRTRTVSKSEERKNPIRCASPPQEWARLDRYSARFLCRRGRGLRKGKGRSC